MTNKSNGHADKTPPTTGTDDLIDVAVPAHSDVDAGFSVRETLRGRRILLTGSTGFLGKVYAAMILRRHPDIEQLYLVIRPRTGETAADRFYQELVESGAFDPLRDVYGPGLNEFLQEKVTVLAGDITDEHLGLTEEEAKALSSQLDVLVNSAGLTNFNPNLKNALEVNTLSSDNIIEFIKLGGSHAKLLHVSTTFVAGRTVKPTPEEAPTPHRYPSHETLEVPLDARREVADCFMMIEHAHRQADDQERQAVFTADAREILRRQNRDPDDRQLFDEVFREVRKAWIKKRLSQDGRERADHWGWVNIYTYTKSLGERLIMEGAGSEIDYTLFRPAIIESAIAFPQPGWNEGINTSAPIIYLSYKGHRFVPTRADRALDVIPVDMTVGAMLTITAALIHRRHHDVYHLGSSDRNRLSMPRVIELTTLGARQLIDRDTKRPGWQKLVLKSLDSIPVDEGTFRRQSLPMFARAARGVQDLLGKVPARQLGGVGKAVTGVSRGARQIEKLATTGEKIFEIFHPFTYENKYTFLARNIEELAAALPEDEKQIYGCPIAELDWRKYWLEVHVPGLSRNVFPNLEAKLKESRRDHWTYEDLVELFDASAKNFEKRVALQHYDGGITERYTYGEMKAYAERGADALRARGIGPGATVMLLAENRPQWGMTYFGILKARAVAVPVDPESSAQQTANLAASSRAAAIVLSDEVLDRIGAELQALLDAQELPTRILTFGSLFTLSISSDEAVDPVPAPVVFPASSPDEAVASLIFTSGTTGDPKGVMLSHSNFTSLLGSLDGTFRVDEHDGFLSVLPLHHTFEFTSGFLMPLSKGSSITYMEELSGDELRSAMQTSRITALIGVPALWQLLHRRIEQNVNESPGFVRWLFHRMVSMNRHLRDRTGLNLGPTLFGAVHEAFGGKIRYMISGGSALPSDVLEAFYGLGFNLYEGYGLTEAAPVLTVNRPTGGLVVGSVGKPLPGIEIEIRNPNDEGVGEVVARGGNIMLGYMDRPEETAKTVQDGWLHTGDLGKVDRKGRLSIVGRSKEIIVTAGGKNVYPDELEEIYGSAPNVIELSVVGLPDPAGNERVACLLRLDVPEDAEEEDIATMRQATREWIRVEGARVAPHNRIQVLRFWDEELPRTATRKVKRREVVEILERLMSAEGPTDTTADAGWLAQTVANLAAADAHSIHEGTHFQDDLGFDSLMTVELASILEARGVSGASMETLATFQTFGDLQAWVDAGGSTTALVRTTKTTSERVRELPIHPVVSKTGKRWLHRAQMRAYGDLFEVDVYGQANIPWHNPNVIVVANHASHLDMGLVKYALGDFGRDIRALAAADYFFRSTARKTYFKNFTNLIPVERSGSPAVALRGAFDALNNGETLLMFPEGTRAPNGKLREFRRGLGYLVASGKVDVLPVSITGTYEALPKGRPLPRPGVRRLKVRIGRLLSARQMMLMAEEQGLSEGEAWDFISARAHDAVSELLHGPGTKATDPVEPLFMELEDKFERDQVDAQVSYYFSLGQIDDHKWTIVVDPDNCYIKQGKPDGGVADCVVKTSPELFRRIVQESYVPSFDEFMDGTIKTNSPDLLMRFQSVFGLMR